MLRAIAVFSAMLMGACAHAETSETKTPATPSAKTSPGQHVDGLVRVASAYSVEETVSRLEAALASRNIKVMAKVDHGANAAGAGHDLAPTVLLIFGNPAAGSQLMTAARSSGIDLPMKALISEQNGLVMLEYNAVAYIAQRHGIDADLPVLAKMEGLLGAVAAEATGTQ